MKRHINKFFYPGIFVALILSTLTAKGQSLTVQTTINKLNSFKSFGYTSIYKQKDFGSDTLIINHKDIFEPAPGDKLFGYRFSLDMIYKGMKLPVTDVYNGRNIISLNPNDSTY